MLLRRPTGAITVVCVTVRVDPEKPLSWPLASGLTFGDLCLAPLPIRAACPQLAQSGHWLVRCTCPLSGAKRT